MATALRGLVRQSPLTREEIAERFSELRRLSRATAQQVGLAMHFAESSANVQVSKFENGIALGIAEDLDKLDAAVVFMASYEDPKGRNRLQADPDRLLGYLLGDFNDLKKCIAPQRAEAKKPAKRRVGSAPSRSHKGG